MVGNTTDSVCDSVWIHMQSQDTKAHLWKPWHKMLYTNIYNIKMSIKMQVEGCRNKVQHAGKGRDEGMQQEDDYRMLTECMRINNAGSRPTWGSLNDCFGLSCVMLLCHSVVLCCFALFLQASHHLFIMHNPFNKVHVDTKAISICRLRVKRHASSNGNKPQRVG